MSVFRPLITLWRKRARVTERVEARLIPIRRRAMPRCVFATKHQHPKVEQVLRGFDRLATVVFSEETEWDVEGLLSVAV
jgi:hypothetical protein